MDTANPVLCPGQFDHQAVLILLEHARELCRPGDKGVRDSGVRGFGIHYRGPIRGEGKNLCGRVWLCFEASSEKGLNGFASFAFERFAVGVEGNGGNGDRDSVLGQNRSRLPRGSAVVLAHGFI